MEDYIRENTSKFNYYSTDQLQLFQLINSTTTTTTTTTSTQFYKFQLINLTTYIFIKFQRVNFKILKYDKFTALLPLKIFEVSSILSKFKKKLKYKQIFNIKLNKKF